MNIAKTFKLMGPGLLYAAAAIGVSHVVQSTRAGAEFGYELVWAIVLANTLKYPFFKAGPLYSSLTGKSLLHGYKKIGRWAIPLFFAMTLLTMFVVQSAVTVVTAGLAQSTFEPLIGAYGLEVTTYSLIILGICAILLGIGKYSVLDSAIKIIVLILTATTVVALVLSAAAPLPKPMPALDFDFGNTLHMFFLVALIGWMPAPMDIPIWQSVWTVAKQESEDEKISVKQSMRDFNIGFIGTAFLAIFFLALGAIVMYQSGEKFADGAAAFAGQFIRIYTSALGDWAWPIIAIAALSTMFSTTLACLDAFARITQEGCVQWSGDRGFHSKFWYLFWLQVTGLGALCILFFYMKNMKAMVDFATTLSFVVAPVFALLNYLVMSKDPEVPNAYRYKGKERTFCLVAIALFTLFSLYYLYLRFI